MTPRAGFAYAQARLQARYGGRPDDVLWRTLEASRTAAHALALTRGGPLAAWTDGLAEATDPHRIEPHLRVRWRQQVETIASWLPLRWQPAARWFAALVELPLADAPAAAERAAQWRGEWRRRLPADAGDAARLAEPAALLMPRLANATALRAAGAEPTRRALERLLRRQAGTAVAVFASLALLALELERLRGILVVRAMFDRAAQAA